MKEEASQKGHSSIPVREYEACAMALLSKLKIMISFARLSTGILTASGDPEPKNKKICNIIFVKAREKHQTSSVFESVKTEEL